MKSSFQKAMKRIAPIFWLYLGPSVSTIVSTVGSCDVSKTDFCAESGFLAGLTVPIIREELDIVNLELGEHPRTDIDGLTDIFKFLECPLEATQTIETLLQCYPGRHQAAERLRHFATSSSVWRTLACQRVMLEESQMYLAVKEGIMDRCQKLYASCNIGALDLPPLQSATWLDRAVYEVYRCCLLRTTFTISSASYLPQIVPPREYTGVLHAFPRNEPAYLALVAATTCEAIFTWLGLPATLFHDIRAYFVCIIVSHLGAGVLLLPRTWEVFEKAPGWLLDNKHRNRTRELRQPRFTSVWMASFQSQVQACNAANTISKEHQMLALLQRKYQECAQCWKVGHSLFLHPYQYRS